MLTDPFRLSVRVTSREKLQTEETKLNITEMYDHLILQLVCETLAI
jgi:hypothetical protein